MKIKVAEAEGAVLDWMVAKAQWGGTPRIDDFGTIFPRRTVKMAVADRKGMLYQPSSDWSIVGPIIEREQIDILHRDMQWTAIDCNEEFVIEGSTPLIAAMRCFVASRLGDEVDVPEELL